jgi:hypothetical protein
VADGDSRTKRKPGDAAESMPAVVAGTGVVMGTEAGQVAGAVDVQPAMHAAAMRSTRRVKWGSERFISGTLCEI